jgi:hypothetical protein
VNVPGTIHHLILVEGRPLPPSHLHFRAHAPQISALTAVA